MAIADKLKGMLDKGRPSGDAAATTQGVARAAPKPGLADYLAREDDDFVGDLSPFLPNDLIGGSIPHVPGTESEAVWNAAAQACGTERVHFCYSIADGRCWYLACPSASMASNPDSWCPLAAALPGNSEYWDRETVYLYEQEGMASALRWDQDTGRMQVFLGAARTLLPRIQSMDANFVTVNPAMAQIVPWRNKALRTEKLSRASAMVLLYVGLFVAVVAFGLLVISFVSVNFVNRDLDKVKVQSDAAAEKLMLDAYGALQSDTIKHVVRVQELLDTLQKVDGTLVRYEVSKGKTEWEALVPQAIGANIPGLSGAKVNPGIEPDGRVRIKGTK